MKRSELTLSALLIPLDALMLLAAFLLAYYLKNNGLIFTPEITGALARVIHYAEPGTIFELPRFFRFLSYTIPAFLIIFALTGLYRIRGRLSWIKLLAQIIAAVSLGVGFILLLFLLRNDFFIPRSIVLYAWGFGSLFVLIGRVLMRIGQRLLRRCGVGIVRLVVVGKQSHALNVYQELNKNPYSTYKLVGLLDQIPLAELLRKLTALTPDELILINENYQSEELIAIRNYCLEHQVSFNFVPELFTALSCSFWVRTELLLPAIEVRPTPLEGWGRVIKRLYDLVVACLLIILALPIMLLIAIWSKLTSPGPLLFRHERIGRHGQLFYLLKFRSFYAQYCTGNGYQGNQAFKALLASNPALALEWEQTSKLKSDPRVSPVGRFLRKTSLDELPQLFNVVAGSMSMVGPRPIVQNELNDEVRKYGETARILFTVKPGVTGLWQVSGRNSVSFAERVRMDAHYIEHWNLWFDIWITVKTVWVVLFERNQGAF